MNLPAQAAIKLSSRATNEFWEIPVLYEDEQLIALDKPACVSVSPDRSNPDRPSLMSLMHAAIADGKPWVRERGLSYLMNTHRLDFETTGVLLLAKTKPALAQLANLFGTGKPVQRYLALVRGEPDEEKFEVNAKLAPNPVRPGLMKVDQKHGKRSCTRFEVMERFSGWTLMACEPVDARNHQVRVHLRHAGLLLAADQLYGGAELLLSKLKPQYRLKPNRHERPLFDRAAVHAERLAFPHPATGEVVTITAPLPRDFSVALKYLRRYAIAG